MRTLVIGAIVLALTGGAANAAFITDPALGALQMTLVYDTNGDAYLMKNTIWNPTGTASVDGYEIRSSADDLSPAGTGWRSLADWNSIDNATLVASLGADSTSFIEVADTTSTKAEITFDPIGAVFHPGAMFQIGTPLAVPPVPGVLTFYYGLSTDTTTDKYLGLIAQIPEPVTIGLLAIGACVALVRRRR